MGTNYLNDIIGQDTAKRFVSTAIQKANLYNFLFTGPKGVGKRMFAFALAKTLGSPPGSPNFTLIGPIPAKLKDKEDKIFEFSKKYLPEHGMVKIADRESILIEQIRNLISTLVHMPLEGSKRVVLIIEADKMTQEAANCMLKTLEEPPLDTLFILTSSRPNYLLPTIQSRCQVVPFSYLNARHIKDILFDSQDSFILGSPGEILRLRDSDIFELVMAIFQATPLEVNSAAAKARELERKNLNEFFYLLMLFYRLVFYNKLKINKEHAYEPEIIKKAENLSFAECINAIWLLNNCINTLEQNPNRLLLIFNTLSKLP